MRCEDEISSRAKARTLQLKTEPCNTPISQKFLCWIEAEKVCVKNSNRKGHEDEYSISNDECSGSKNEG